MAIPAKRLYTPTEYLEFEETSAEKHEYDGGEIRAMTGASVSHNRIVSNLLAALHHALRQQPCDVFGSDMRVRVKEAGLYTYPDLSVVCGKIEFDKGRNDTITNPLLIGEVLSAATRTYDRGRKFDLYRNIKTLQDYVLVDQLQAHVEYFHRLDDGTWALEEHTGLTAKLTLQAVNVSISLKEIYRRVELSALHLKRTSQQTVKRRK